MPRLVSALLLTATVAAAPLAPAAVAKDGDVRRAGSCTEGSSTKIKLGARDGGIEAEFEVDQNRSGVRWKVTISQNGKRVISTSAKTSGASGSFSIERRLANTSGKDSITARATSPSGEVCTAKASI